MRGNFDGGGEIFRDGSVEIEFAALLHVECEKSCEGFCDGTDFEQSVRIDLLIGAVVELSSLKNFRPMLIEQGNDHAGVGVGEIVLEKVLDGCGIGESLCADW